MATEVVTPTVGAGGSSVVSGESRGDARVARVLGSRRAQLSFASIVFVTTVVQVLINPLVGILTGQIQWVHPLPLGVAMIVAAVGCAAQSCALLLSVRRPALAVFGTLACYLALAVGLGVPTWVQPAQLVVGIALFLLSTRRSLRESVSWFFFAAAAVVAGTIWWGFSTGAPAGAVTGFVLLQGTSFVATGAGATAFGVWWGVRTRRVTRAQEIAEAASVEHEQRLQAARVQERARIAQELHDVAAQHIAGLLSLADAAIDLEKRDPAIALALLEDMRVEGRFASASLYAALRELRAVDGGEAERTPDLGKLLELFTYWRKRGMALETHVELVEADVPAAVSTSAYRGIQEALTNAAKHAPGAGVVVDVSIADERLSVTVVNDAPRGGPLQSENLGLGWGLEGLRERVRLLKGTVDAGTAPGGGWRVTFELPVTQTDSAATTER